MKLDHRQIKNNYDDFNAENVYFAAAALANFALLIQCMNARKLTKISRLNTYQIMLVVGENQTIIKILEKQKAR